MLYSSKRNSSLDRSVSSKCLSNAKSQLLYPGPSRIFRPELPKRGVPARSASCREEMLKQLVSNQLLVVFFPTPLQVRSGRGFVEFVWEKSCDRTVKGKPD